jgi:hypothetical protein
MQAKIVTEKIVVRGEKRRKIVRMDECLGYLIGIAPSDIAEEDYQAMIVWMRRAGARLAKINARLAKENADWCGEETVEI